MPSTNQANSRQYWSCGRGFASVDPERRGEVIGFVRSGAIETTAPARVPTPAGRTLHREWMRVQPEPEGSFEGSSSRRSR